MSDASLNQIWKKNKAQYPSFKVFAEMYNKTPKEDFKNMIAQDPQSNLDGSTQINDLYNHNPTLAVLPSPVSGLNQTQQPTVTDANSNSNIQSNTASVPQNNTTILGMGKPQFYVGIALITVATALIIYHYNKKAA